MLDTPEEFLRDLFHNTLSHANASEKLAEALRQLPQAKRCVVLGAGKAAARMAGVAAKCRPDIDGGLVIVPNGYGAPCDPIEIVEAGHPVPDEAGLDATTRILEIAESLTKGDMAIVLLSGGGSSLLCAPLEPLGLAEKQALTRQLLAAGADIHEINCVRRHLSQIKGGRLARAAYPAKLFAFVISDVVGNVLSDIASGPTVGDPTTVADVRAVLAKYAIPETPTLTSALASPKAASVGVGAPCLAHATTQVIMTPEEAFATTLAGVSDAQIDVNFLGTTVTGEAAEVAKDHCRLAIAALQKTTPSLILSGGELTVTGAPVTARGGPNQTYALSAAIHLEGRAGIYLLACDTDGKDGNSDHAGALVTPNTLAAAQTRGLNATDMLVAHQSHAFFATLNQAIITGPTRNNINDFRALLVIPPALFN